MEQPSWKAALDDLREARTILLLGATDTGKTTFLTWLANMLLLQERRIGIVDADVGQSSLGPPTTIGLSIVAEPFQRLQELPPATLHFVGATSPRGHLVPMIVGTKRLVDCARRCDVGQVIIDTCGFIRADGGQLLKHYQTRAVGMRIRTWLVEELHGTLLGLLDEAGETVGIGILQHIDFAYHRLEVLTAEGIAGIRGVHWSRTRMGPSGDLDHVLSTAR